MKPRLFCEFPAGLAAVSLRLHGGEHCRPPISRMGSKSGYAAVILAVLGLRSGQGAGAYCWAEADQDVAALLRTYPDADMLRRVAEIIRGWAGEEPRALWERLRAERKARGVRVDAEVARWTALQGGASYSAPVTLGADGATQPAGGLTLDPNRNPNGAHGGGWPESTADACHRLAEYAAIVSSNRLINMAGPDLMNTGNGGTRHGGDFATPVGDVAERFEGMAREVAGLVAMAPWAYREGMPDSGFCQSKAVPGVWSDGATRAPRTEHLTGDGVRAVEAGGWPPVLVLPAIPEAADVAAWMGTPGDLEGCVVYADPPYQNTTGYAANLTRAEVVAYALAYDALGATVCVSEAVPVEELTALGWHTTDIAGGRKGQRRTFARVATEALTMNRAPAHRVATQGALFGAA